MREAVATLTQHGKLPADSGWAGFVRDDAAQRPATFAKRHGGSILLASLHPGHVIQLPGFGVTARTVGEVSEP